MTRTNQSTSNSLDRYTMSSSSSSLSSSSSCQYNLHMAHNYKMRTNQLITCEWWLNTRLSVRRDDILTCCREDVKQGLISIKSKMYDHLKLDCDDGTNVTLMRSMRSLHWLGFCSGERVNISFMEGLRTRLLETLSVFSICKKPTFIKWEIGRNNF